MIYRVGNLKFSTQRGLERALERNGAVFARFENVTNLRVQWSAGLETYTCDAEGRFPQQLEFDFYPDRRKA